MYPFLKWLGGKRKASEDIIKKIYPKKIRDYYEPFLGGGSVFIDVLNHVADGNLEIMGCMYLSDINADLIKTYQVIQDRDTICKLIERLQEYEKQYKTNDMLSLYEKKRKEYNEINKTTCADIELASLFIFLNKTCFRGMYRVSSKGKFNVPFGNYKKITFDTDNIMSIHRAIAPESSVCPIVFECKDYKQVLSTDSFKINDVIYVDPPYLPVKSTSFVMYEKSGSSFSHEELAKLLKGIVDRTEMCVIVSNSETAKELYRWAIIEIVNCPRRINPKHPESMENEIIAYHTKKD